MKPRLWVPLAAALLSACAQEAPAPPAQMSGVNDLVVVGNWLFVTSTDDSELRVLDLRTPEFATANVVQLEWVRAPNPLEPLRIPVLARPLGLARDFRYEGGEELPGSFVYAISDGSSEISVVAADPTADEASQLVEVVRLREAAPVTAVAGRASSPGVSTLFYATYDGTAARLWRRELSGAPVQASAAVEIPLPTANPVAALLPRPDPDELVVATRAVPGGMGATVTLRLSDGTQAPLQFPAPVRQLATHPQYGIDGVVVPAGRYLYAVLDEGACGLVPAGAACRGVVAVDTVTGMVALDARGVSMEIFTQGEALARGLALAEGPFTGDLANVPLLGMVTYATGRLLFFDAARFRAIDSEPSSAVPVLEVFRRADGGTEPLPVAPGDTGVAPDGGTESPNRFVSELVATEGAVYTELVSITYEGVIPGFEAIPVPASASVLALPATAPASRVQVGDLVVCMGETTVTAVAPDALTLASSCPAGTATVRAGGSQPFTVVGAFSGYRGRVGFGQTFTPESTTFFYPSDQYSPTAPAFSFRLGEGSEPPFLRDDRYQIGFSSGVDDYFLNVVPTANLVPGSIAADPGYQDRPSKGVFVAYPGGDEVLQLTVDQLVPRAENNQGRNVVAYQ